MTKFTQLKGIHIIITVVAFSVCYLILKEMIRPNLAENKNDSSHDRRSSAQVKIKSVEERAANRSRIMKRRSRSRGEMIDMVISSMNHLNERQVEESNAAILNMSVKDIDKLLDHQEFQDLSFTDPFENQLFGTCFTRMAMLDPEHAINYRKRLSSSGNFHALISIFKQWLQDDESRAREVALQMKDDVYLDNEIVFLPGVIVRGFDDERATKLLE